MSPPPSPPPRPRALLLDLDGTLVDSRRDIAGALNVALVACGRAPLALADVLPLVGDGARVLVQRALRATSATSAAAHLGTSEGALPSDDALVEEAVAAFQRAYLAAPCVHTTLLPGARALIEASAALGVPCALVTNKPRAVTILVLDALGVREQLRAVWAGGDGPLKPAPDSVLATAAELGVPPSETWMIGDGPQDVLAGRAAGAFTIAVPGIAERERVLAARPDLVVASLDEIVDLLRSSVGGVGGSGVVR